MENGRGFFKKLENKSEEILEVLRPFQWGLVGVAVESCYRFKCARRALRSHLGNYKIFLARPILGILGVCRT